MGVLLLGKKSQKSMILIHHVMIYLTKIKPHPLKKDSFRLLRRNIDQFCAEEPEEPIDYRRWFPLAVECLNSKLLGSCFTTLQTDALQQRFFLRWSLLSIPLGVVLTNTWIPTDDQISSIWPQLILLTCMEVCLFFLLGLIFFYLNI